jgi:hypothetical protein
MRKSRALISDSLQFDKVSPNLVFVTRQHGGAPFYCSGNGEINQVFPSGVYRALI